MISASNPIMVDKSDVLVNYKDKVTICPYGIDTAYFTELDDEDKKTYRI